MFLERFPKLQQWLAGTRQPTLRQLEQFAAATRTPFGFLFLQQPPVEAMPITNYRTPGSEPLGRPSADLLDTIYAMQRRQDWMRDYLTEIGQLPLPFVGSAKLSDSVEQVATRIRSTLNLAPDWASHHSTFEEAQRALRIAMDAAGILVVINGIVGQNSHRSLNPDEFRGFVLIDSIAPVVFVNNADAGSAKMFHLGP